MKRFHHPLNHRVTYAKMPLHMKIYSSIALTMICAALTLTGCTLGKGDTIAQVDDQRITSAEVKGLLVNMTSRLRARALDKRKEFLDQLITERLLLSAAEKRGVQQLQEVKDLLKEARKKILIAKYIDQETENKITISDQECRDYYETHKDRFMTASRIRASQILVPTRPEAESARTEVQSGAEFAKVAQLRSIDPTKERGGDLGYFQQGQLIPELEAQAMKLKIGEMSEVFESKFGFHILKVTDRIEPRLLEFNEIKERLQGLMMAEKKQRLMDELLEKLRSRAHIVINEKALKQFTLD